jgi:hypothetical protein
MTLGGAAAAQVRLIVWCKDCQHQVEPDPGEMAQRYGDGARLERPARLLPVRQPSNRYGRNRSTAGIAPQARVR